MRTQPGAATGSSARGALCATATVAVLLCACTAPPRPAIVYLTDFGLADGAVAAMKGVARGVDRSLALEDLTHQIPPFDVWQAAYRLHQTAPYWPAGTVFVSVVDPGVGTDRRAVVARDRDGRLYVTPDNGTLTLLATDGAITDVRLLDTTVVRRAGSESSHTFHGRDVYSFVAARLAAGNVAFDDVGGLAPIESLVRLDVPRALVERTDRGLRATGFVPVLDVQYGNVWTNLRVAALEAAGLTIGRTLTVRIQEEGTTAFSGEMPFVRTFGDVPDGAPLAYTNSLGNLAFACNLGSFAQRHSIGSGPRWTVIVETK
jgi:S-adenosylmethionine hydrolase